MKKCLLNVLLSLAVLMTLPSIAQNASAAEWTAHLISGKYVLYRIDDPKMEPITEMIFTAEDEISFLVQGVDQARAGIGKITDNQGYYDWQFTDGKTGRTTFIINDDGTIKGHVNGDGIDWEYIAHKTAELGDDLSPDFLPQISRFREYLLDFVVKAEMKKLSLL